MEEILRMINQVSSLQEQRKYNEILELLTKDVLEKLNSDSLYRMRGDVLFDKGDYDKALADYSKAIELNPKIEFNYICLGMAWNRKGESDKAIYFYNKAIDINPKYDYAYTCIGNVWYELGNYDKAIDYYNKALDLTADAYTYTMRGNSYSKKEDYDIALADYSKAIGSDDKYDYAYFKRAELRTSLGKDPENSINDFQKVIELINDEDHIWVKRAKDTIRELTEKIKDSALNEIAELISKIKKTLLITDGCVTHYTNLSVIKLLLFDENIKFRISEGSFLNDTSEGTELFNYLKYPLYSLSKEGLEAAIFAPKPFIGSFVAENKHDDLSMWRFYGKENGVEAKGCSITFRIKEFIEAINSLFSKNDLNMTSTDDINFYRVAYRNPNSTNKVFQIPNAKIEDEETFNNLMGELKEKVSDYKAEDNLILEKYLNNIAFLFKSDMYKNENELRLVIKGIEFDKKIDTNKNPPYVYIELVNVRKIVEQITLGPKVEKAVEWASALHFIYEKEMDEKKKPKRILISRLPFK